MNFKVGDRVVAESEVHDNKDNLSLWSGEITEVGIDGEFVKIKADKGIDWTDYPESLISEELYNSPLYKALL